MKKNRNPITVFTIGIFIAFISLGVLISKRTVLQNNQDLSLLRNHNSNVNLKIEHEDSFWDGDTLVITTKIERTDPNVMAMGADIEHTYLDEDGYERHSWVSVPEPGFGTDAWYISDCIRGMSQEEARNLETVLDTEYTWEKSLNDYEYLHTVKSTEEKIESWSKEYARFPIITQDQIIGNTVVFTVSPASHEAESLYGQVLVEYFDGSKCVYADVCDYEGIHEKDLNLPVSYTPPCSLPEWNEVRLIPLY